MLENYLPILIFIAIAIGIGVGPILIGFGLLLFSRRSLTREFIEPMRTVLVGMRLPCALEY